MPPFDEKPMPHRASVVPVIFAVFALVVIVFVGDRGVEVYFRRHTVQLDVLEEMPLWPTSDCPIPSEHRVAPSTVQPVMARAFAVHYGKDYQAFHVALPDGRVGYLCPRRNEVAVADGELPEEIW